GVVKLAKIGEPNDVPASVWYQSKVDHYLALVKFYLVRGYGFGALLSRLARVVVRAGRSTAEVRVISFFFSPLFFGAFRGYYIWCIIIIIGAFSSSLCIIIIIRASSRHHNHHHRIIIIIIIRASSRPRRIIILIGASSSSSVHTT
ncbi:hypothetical protein PIB30_097459, partial [Stylosanthes scabra]|nr:hypothetical protein [Stylosanthes scabra]